ncbi:NAD(P)-dependent oxidoreductase [Microlunatus sp. Gsoil 973]|uniref:NAD-dependent epimerase/dehydratase family protein n=1 Tax=Microlunatus sp. Gsoil 973 TaxID=2672569 RepID=UPI0012B49DCD|nr:NAD(P)-dependent oxidoreductase [Microlunatus sp. Gsoil 973]QGN34613.1 NAD-dependent epimerase/dehydratase family protein [Microlunatus sp. Gsoil 973]
MSDAHPLAGKRILVTGAEGNIGSAVCERLAGHGALITGLSLVPAARAGRPEPPMDRVLHGDTTDVDTVADALEGVELVVHLAAIPSPGGHPPYTVFRTNVNSTFNVLSQAGERGVRRAVFASSINHTGLPFNSHDVLPAYYPMDEQLPSDLDDGYALSKYVDEITARMVHRHWGVDSVGFRFPFVAPAEMIARHSERSTQDPVPGAREGWSYLDVRDAALAVELALLAPVTGSVPVYVTADNTLVPYRTEELLDRYAPGVPRNRRFVEREVAVDLTRARTLLGFRAEHQLELSTRPLP